MLFCTQQFLLFFVLVFLTYWLLPWARARVWLLLGASFFFYASWNKWLACLVFATSALDYWLALAITQAGNSRRRRLLLGASLTINLGLLIYLKYANFFLESVEQALQLAGMSASFPLLQVILPIGISFYTFEAINYMVDVYRGKMPAEKDFAHFLLFILFFPHLVAGPIVRAKDFLPQIRRSKRWSWLRLQIGGQCILLGMFKKMVLADHMARLADPVFAQPEAYATGVLWLGALAYAIQIFCDFSGYSDLAIGTAHLLGYRLTQNFNLPYLATNIADFWRRWHMSLSNWFRDYLFIPLGGSRGSFPLVARNLLVTMTLCGLWHGASWTFVAWGVLHGLYLVGHRVFRGFMEQARWAERWDAAEGKVLGVALTFLAVLVGWILFRAPTFHQAGAYLTGMFRLQGGLGCPIPISCFWQVLAVVVAGHWLGHQDRWQRLYLHAPAPMRGLGYACLLIVTLMLAPVTSQMFIYFQF
jgi:alginate O-acetyltransferase complex protein AlgI